MAYDHRRDIAKLRHAIETMIKEDGFSEVGIVKYYAEIKKPGAYVRSNIARSTIRNLLAGKALRKSSKEMACLFDAISDDNNYGKRLISEQNTAIPHRIVDFADALSAFFLNTEGHQRDFISTLRVHFGGEYIMSRRNRDYDAALDEVRLSEVRISAIENGIKIEEIQNYQKDHKRDGNNQHDEGYVFRFTNKTYFLMKSIRGTAVKFGVIEHFEPGIGHLSESEKVEYFQGYIFVSSDRGIFERTAFFCRRYAKATHPITSGIMTLSEIQNLDPRAKSYILQDWGNKLPIS
jgi:hypothetical protein